MIHFNTPTNTKEILALEFVQGSSLVEVECFPPHIFNHDPWPSYMYFFHYVLLDPITYQALEVFPLPNSPEIPGPNAKLITEEI